ncbi:hypothetical protein CCZ01_07855 [Helicobacter monodelphidis]|uniref:helix-turn-helix domain-containing protein n=1 Tax=Helicobacter sp. 15-1451 TaxID=2004995 RepID=UPI000DCDDABB|nr:helix-turn-helix domain-containing protein [Helicobacter sp. 15-1451]RAX56958.1 hypothetical protein CCZ01_07855 [Helicobacter sp. 15-1451]
MKEFYTIREISAYLEIHEKTVRNWIRKGKIKSYKQGKIRIIHSSELQRIYHKIQKEQK